LSAAAVLAAIDIINDVESQVAVITHRTDVFIEGVVEVEPLEQEIEHWVAQEE
jgi:hypothetical protein